jgi:hypothetical protein
MRNYVYSNVQARVLALFLIISDEQEVPLDALNGTLPAPPLSIENGIKPAKIWALDRIWKSFWERFWAKNRASLKKLHNMDV